MAWFWGKGGGVGSGILLFAVVCICLLSLKSSWFRPSAAFLWKHYLDSVNADLSFSISVLF